MLLVKVKKPGLLVELGTHTGNSYCAMCQSIKLHQLNTRAFAIDTWKGDSQAGLYDEKVLFQLREHHDPLYGDFSQLIQSTFDEALKYFSSGSIDLLHIDGYHIYDAVKHDFENWLPKVSPDGIIVFHDINVREKEFGAWKLWEEIRGRFMSFEFPHAHGLGVLALSNNQPETLKRILQSSPRQAALLRDFFGALGNRLTLQLQNKSVDDICEDSDGSNAVLRSGYLQLFFPTDFGYREEASLRQPLAEGKWQQVSFEIEPLETSGAIRIDPLERPGLVEIAGITVRNRKDGSILWRTRASDIAEKAAVEGTALALPSPGRLSLFCHGNDARVMLPQVPEGCPLGLDIWIKVHPDLFPVAQRIGELEQDLFSSQKHLAERDARLAYLDQEISSLQKALDDRKVRLEEIEAVNTELSRKFAEEQAKLAELQKDNERLAARLTAQQKKSARELRASQTVLFRKQTRIDKLEKSLQDLEVQFERIHRTRSWRITRPLRWAKQSRLGKLVKSVYWWVSGRGRYWKKIKREAKYLQSCELFDAVFYCEQCPDIVAAGISAEEHFIRFGIAEGRNPNPLFDTAYYLSQNPDDVNAAFNPLRHYLEQGANPKINPHPLFDQAYYLSQHPDLDNTASNPLLHFIQKGAKEGYDPSPLFSTVFYLVKNPDVAAAGLNPLIHFIKYGWAEMRDPHPQFNVTLYLEKYPDVAAAGINPLLHYIQFGAAEGRILDASSPADFHYAIPEVLDRFDAWLAVNEFTEQDAAALENALTEHASRLPRISVVMPVYNTPLPMLDQAIASVVGQIYENWELCIADDGSSEPEIRELIEVRARQDRRIKFVFFEENRGISSATNSAASLATGDVLAFLDHDDELTSDALAEVALCYARHPEADLVYSDDDKIDAEGKRYDPQFKPDWSPTLLLSYAYTSHLLSVRRSLFEKVGGFRTDFEGSQDYDFVLRASEQARHVAHIPKILYHWRATPGSTAVAGDAKQGAIEAGRRAVEEAFQRRGHKAGIFQPEWAQDRKLGIFHAEFPHEGPPVTIIIPTRNGLDLLRRCLASLEKTLYRNYEVLLIDNESDDPETIRYLQRVEHRVIHVKNPNGSFNFSHIINQAALVAEGDYLLFLNNDTEVVSPEWLSQMVGYIQMGGVAAVGARLMYPDGTIQHAGVVHGYYHGLMGHAFKNTAVWSSYLNYASVAREYSAVTGACMLTPRPLFIDTGGFDEENFAVAYNDVDYCYRLVEQGYRCVCAPVELLHHENASRGPVDNPEEEAAVRHKYGKRVDPWYNPNLSLDDETFKIRPYHDARWAKTPIRAVLFSHNLNHEGAPRSLLELVTGLTDQAVVDPLVVSPVDGPLRTEFESLGVRVRVIQGPDVRDADKFRSQIKNIIDMIRQSEAGLVYANTAQSFWAIHAARTAGVPSIWSVRESEPWEHYFEFVNQELRDLAYDCFVWPYRVVFVSDKTKQAWSPLNTHHNFAVIPNGLDLKRLSEQGKRWSRKSAREKLGIEDEELAVVLMGTICERKGQLDLVQAIHQLEAEVAERCRFFLVGDRPSPYSEYLNSYVAALPPFLKSRINIVPETKEVVLYYKAADISVCTSRLESYPRVTMEAMAFGLPQVATPVFGISEQLREGVNGLFYPPGEVRKLADALTDLIVNDDLRARLARNAQPSLAALISYEEMIACYGALFREAFLAAPFK